MRPLQLRKLILAALKDAKARDIVVLDMRKIVVFTDYMIIVTGTSNRHVVAVADNVMDDLRDAGRRRSGVEGMESGDWVLIDFGDVVVHVMRAQTRDFYGLEKLWSEAKQIKP
ncbi:MAG: ribosome silencing factor [Candidatus Muproteobacteria bacterium RBG_16_60_9]|uniref:Ribosomal silencing factor RsfS n=1 Tax=Candidatus Muproteobacteria bacterium RBG_16_60_9 TaxID=1817755 RepID=A0A1F6VDK4_9PROT|nr:MAG: ribosome silencing factor [Candidatus Muproteobacteria bacterium RBG_16_60_9]